MISMTTILPHSSAMLDRAALVVKQARRRWRKSHFLTANEQCRRWGVC